MNAGIRGLLFDKDGTLFDFQATWGGWNADLLLGLAAGDPQLAADLAGRIGLDLERRCFWPGSIAIAGTSAEVAAALVPALPDFDQGSLLRHMSVRSLDATPVPVVPLGPLLSRLRRAGFILGVATNDVESAARRQLAAEGVCDAFDVIIGVDSGHGAKPAPGQCLAFCAATGLRPGQVVMIGDSTHDLRAAAAAGMIPVGVLTGPAATEDLAPHAATVLPDIGHLPDWLGIDADPGR